MLSNSPLVPHIEEGSGADWLRSLAVRPKAVKVFSSGACRDVKGIDPAITTIKRRYVTPDDPYLDEGALGGKRFVEEQDDLSGVDILEGLNECVPGSDTQAIKRANDFHVGFVEACRACGVTPCILNIAVGNPDLGELRHLVPSVQAVVDAGGYVGYHGYGPIRLLHAEEWFAHRSILKIEPLLRELGVTGAIRWLYTEAGFDAISDQSIPSGGWRAMVSKGHLTIESAQQQYAAYAQRCRELNIDIACVFTFWGSEEWRKYEHADLPEMLAWFAQHWAENVGVAPQPQPQPQPQPEPQPEPQPQPQPEPPGPAQKVVYAKPGPTYTFINVRRSPDTSEESDMGDIPRGQAIIVEGEEGAFYKIVAYVAKSVTAAEPLSVRQPLFSYPVQGRAPKINHLYGEPRSYGPHEGLDLYARSGDIIVPVLDGVVDKVRRVDPGTGYGIYVRVHHDLRASLGKEYKSWYGHLEDVMVEEGMEVKAGETQLGHAGTTGNSTGIHLHLTFQEVGLHNGLVVDGAIDPVEHLGQ
jgi:murein DD-endopeptidase MepM/ murein hydrolase activator NlpD